MKNLGDKKDINKVTFLLITLSTLIFYNLARLFCTTYCLSTHWYQVILYDNLHHYQLGIVILFFSFLLLKNRKKVKNVLIALGIGMIIDESMYMLFLLGFKKFTHYHVEGIVFEFLVFFIYAYIYLLFIRKIN